MNSEHYSGVANLTIVLSGNYKQGNDVYFDSAKNLVHEVQVGLQVPTSYQ